jgi:hypothetical protein
MKLQTIFGSLRAAQPPLHGGTSYVRPGAALKQITGRLSLWRARVRARRQLRDVCQLDVDPRVLLQAFGRTGVALRKRGVYISRRKEGVRPFTRIGDRQP